MKSKIFQASLIFILISSISCNEPLIDEQTATLNKENLYIWIYTPHITPGGKVKMYIKQYISVGVINFSRIRVVMRDNQNKILFSVLGKGKTWTNKIAWRGGEDSFDEADVIFNLPEDLSPGQLNLILKIECAYAYPTYPGFKDKIGTTEVPLELTLDKKLRVLLARIKYLLFLILLIGVPWLAFGVLHHFKRLKQIKEFLDYYSFLKFITYVLGLIGFVLVGAINSINMKLLCGSGSFFLSIISWILFIPGWITLWFSILPHSPSLYIDD